MDYCSCRDCRSVLSPAAYLVDLLQFIDREPVGADPGRQNPLSVLLKRRPDIAELPLTCENTNTPIEYIDLVNETLEYWVSHNDAAGKHSLDGFSGYDTPADLDPAAILAAPVNVDSNAYVTLQGQKYPWPLPFHRPLEVVRRFFGVLGIDLADVLETFRTSDALEAQANDIGWRNILMERLRLSRPAHAILTNGSTSLADLFGLEGQSDAAARAALTNARTLCQRLAITYVELIEMLRTEFINPHAAQVAKLEATGLRPATIGGPQGGED